MAPQVEYQYTQLMDLKEPEGGPKQEKHTKKWAFRNERRRLEAIIGEKTRTQKCIAAVCIRASFASSHWRSELSAVGDGRGPTLVVAPDSQRNGAAIPKYINIHVSTSRNNIRKNKGEGKRNEQLYNGNIFSWHHAKASNWQFVQWRSLELVHTTSVLP